MQTLEWMYRPIPFMERCRRRYGPIFSIRLGPGGRVVMIADPRIAKQVMAGDPEMFRAGDTNGLFRPVVGSHSILLLDGEEHLRHRRIMLPAFGGSTPSSSPTRFARSPRSGSPRGSPAIG